MFEISFQNSKGQKSYCKFFGVRSELLLSIVTRYTSKAVGKALLVKHICKLCCFSSALAMIFHAYMSVKYRASKIMLCMLQTGERVHFNCKRLNVLNVNIDL